MTAVPAGGSVGGLTDGLAAAAPWLGALGDVLAAVALWAVGSRLRLPPAPRAAVVACFALTALLVDGPGGSGGVGLGGVAAALAALAALLAVAGRARAVLSAGCALGAVVVAPFVGVGLLVLAGGMVAQRGLAARLPERVRRAAAAGALAAAVLLGAALVYRSGPGATPWSAPPVMLAWWTFTVLALLWPRLPWARPVGAAASAMLVGGWWTGDSATLMVVAAVVAVLAMLFVQECRSPLHRVALLVVGAAAVLAPVLLPAGSPRATGQPLVAAAAGHDDAVAVRPVSIAIPALGLTGPLGELGTDPVTGELSAPDDPATAGWFATGVVPGDVGPAVVGGHVDSRTGPGVFFRLGELAAGDLVHVDRSDGRTVTFTVVAVQRFPKQHFPTDAVYGATPLPELRLVTCGGPFDRSVRSYEDNVVVTAALVQ
jgi:hypothetical protein